MDFKNAYETIKIIFETVWWIVSNFPGLVIPCIIASILAAIFHWKNSIRDLAEDIIGLLF